MIHHRPLHVALRALIRSLPLAVLTSLACFLLSAFCLLPTAFGQSATATLSGTVEDPNGAVVAGARVKVVNLGTGLERDATTNDSGTFTIPLLPPSTYTLRVEHDGFVTIEVSDVVLNVNDERSLKIQMRVGDVKEVVNVTDEASLISESPAVGTVVDRQFVENMPLNGRSFQSLIILTPGAVITKSNTNELGQFSVNGQRADANYFTVDGVGANVGISAGGLLGQTGGGATPAFAVTGGTNNLVSMDALQEFKIQTSTYAPEFGRTPGAQVSIVTRAGTNEFHGKLFEYLRNDALDANDWFANRLGAKKPPLRQNDFGGVIGGPILLPHLGEGGRQPGYDGRNKSFFFFSYEGLRLRLPQVVTVIVPSLTTRQTAAAQVRPFLNGYPVPNGNIFASGLAEFSAVYSDPSTLNATSLRVDHTVNAKLTLFGRYNYSPSRSIQRGAGNSLNSLRHAQLNLETLTLGATQSFTSTLSNEFRANYSRGDGKSFLELDNFGGATPPPDSLMFPSFTTSEQSFFSFGISGASTLATGRNVENVQRQINLVDNLSFISGAHQLKAGVDYRLLLPINGLQEYFQTVTFPGLTGLVSGVAQSATVAAQKVVPFLSSNFSAYGQDTWKVSRRLTLTYGLRYEVNPPLRGRNGKDLVTFRDTKNLPADLTLEPPGTPLFKTTYNNVAPRIGLAYALSQRSGRETVIRGGFGVFYDLGLGSLASASVFFPNSATRTMSNVPFPLTIERATPPAFSNTLPASGGTIRVADRELKLPYTLQGNFSIEQSLGSDQSVTASYVTALGRRLLRQENIRTANLLSIFVTRNTATSDYHALQLQFQRRLSRNLQALASYTWSHSIDIASTDSGATPPGGLINPSVDRGSSDFDVRHILSAAISYDIPTPFDRGLGKAVLGNWGIDTLVIVRSSSPVNLIGNVNTVGFSASLRPDLKAGVPLYIDDPSAPGGRRFNPAAFSSPPQGRQGTFGRNVIRGFPVNQVDLAVRRQFNLSERVNLQLRVELFNLFNHPNFADPVNDIRNPNFGRSTTMLGRSLGSGGISGGLNPLYQVGGPRSIQLSAKLNF